MHWISATNDGRVMALDSGSTFIQVFGDEGRHLYKFHLVAFFLQMFQDCVQPIK